LSDRSSAHGAKAIIKTVKPPKVITRKTMIILITVIILLAFGSDDHPGPA
jgi:hypothetical protein